MTLAIPSPHEPFVDKKTGKVAEVWYRFLSRAVIDLNAAASSTALSGYAPSTYATQADEEAGTSSTAICTPSVQQYHPSAAKAWGMVTASGTVATLTTGYNVSSVAGSSIGQVTVNLATGFSSTNYGVLLTPINVAAGALATAVVSTGQASTTFIIQAASTVFSSGYAFACYGDQ